jgi:hypothetical protein
MEDYGGGASDPGSMGALQFSQSQPTSWWDTAKSGLNSAWNFASGPQQEGGSPYQGFMRDPRFWIGAAGTAGGGLGAILQARANQQWQNQQGRLIKQMNQFAGSAPDVNAYLNPVRGPAEDAYLRQLKADMATSGIPMDSSYARNMSAEGLAGQEAMWYSQAQQRAMQAKQDQLKQMAMGLQYPGASPGMLEALLGTNMGGLGNWANMVGEQSNQAKAQQAQMQQMARLREMIKGMQGGGMTQTQNLPGMEQPQQPMPGQTMNPYQDFGPSYPTAA